MRNLKEIARDENIILLAIFLLSLALRISYLLLVKEDVLVLEEFSYFSIGGDLAEGKGFGPKGAGFAPLYSLFLAPTYYLFGEFKADVAIKAIQLILGAFSCIFIFLAAKRIFNVKVGLISAFIFSFYDGMFFLNVHLLPENLIIPLGLLLFIVLLRYQQEKTLPGLLLSGILAGLLLLADPKTFVLIGFLMVWIVLFSSKKIVSLLLFLLFVGLTVSPWVIKNHPLLIDSNTKETLFKYNYPYGASRLQEETEKQEKNLATENTENTEKEFLSSLSSYLSVNSVNSVNSVACFPISEPDLSKILAFINEDPGEYFSFFLKKLRFNLKNFLFSEKMWFEGATQKPTISVGKIRTSIPLISWKMLSLFVLLGIFLALKLWPKTSLLYFFSFAWLTSILVLLAGFPRFRLPLIPFFVIFASFGIYSIFRLVGDAHPTRRYSL